MGLKALGYQQISLVTGSATALTLPTIANPTTQATVNVTGGGSVGGGLLPGTYYVAYTFVSAQGGGETQVGSSESAQFTVATAGNVPQVTLPKLPPGVDSIKVYLTLTNGASASETLYASGVRALTFNLTAAMQKGQASPPGSNNALAGANHVLMNFEAQQARWRDDGTDPTGTVGMLQQANDYLIYNGERPDKFKAIAVASGAILNVSYYRTP